MKQAVLLAVAPPSSCGGLAPDQLNAAVVALLTRAYDSGLVLRDQFDLGFAMAKTALAGSLAQSSSLNDLMEQLQAAGVGLVAQETLQDSPGADVSADGATSMASSDCSKSQASEARQSRAAVLCEVGN